MRLDRDPALDVRCPKCGAEPRKRCRKMNAKQPGKTLIKEPHRERVELSDRN